jgi:hypothetical protein
MLNSGLGAVWYGAGAGQNVWRCALVGLVGQILYSNPFQVFIQFDANPAFWAYVRRLKKNGGGRFYQHRLGLMGGVQ